MKTSPISRRALLSGAGGVALALPFLRSARGQVPVTAPKRIIFWVTPNGVPMEHWRCSIAGTEATEFELSPILAPLESIRADCTFVEGIGYESSYDPQGHAGAHEAGCSSMWTGTWAGPGSQFGGDGKFAGWAISESIDHALAQEIGGETKFPAYYLGAFPSAGILGSRMFYAGKDAPISPTFDPLKVWDAMFSELSLDLEAQGKLLSHRKRVLDAVTAEAHALRCQLDAEDRVRLDAHLTQVDELASRLDKGGSGSPACEAPVLGDVPSALDFDELPTLGKQQIDQTVMMLACDLTRVVGFQWVHPGNNSIYSFIGQSQGHHEVTHENTPSANLELADVLAWYSGQLRYLVERLKATEDVDGQSVFDNTVIVCASECGDPWIHQRHDVAFTLIGSGQGYFKTGRYIKVPAQTPHNRLLLSLFECMGAPRSSFGGASYCAAGPLDQLRA